MHSRQEATVERTAFTSAELSTSFAHPVGEYLRPPLRQRTITRFFREIIETLALVVGIFTLVNLATARFVVDGHSMLPNFDTGQWLLISRAHYLLGEPQRGDIVVFHYPRDPAQDYIKRLIGLPGDTVEIRGTQVLVNGIELQEPYINEACLPAQCPDRMWQLGADEFFLMGDNRNHSSDSRVDSVGVIHRRYIVGEALVRYWPPSAWGIVTDIGFPG